MPVIKRAIKKFSFFSVLTLACLFSQAQINQPAADTTVVSNKSGSVVLVNVTGVIKDAATGKPLSGIRVTYKALTAAITDANGTFTLKVPDYNVAVIAEGEGFQSKEIALKGRRMVTTSLYEDTYSSFYDAANLPFESRPQNHIAHAVTSIQTGGNWGRFSETPDSYLQGKVAGLNAIRRSGTPNIGASLFLRGLNSLYAANQPLIVVDGVIYDNTDNGGSIISNHYTNPMAYIDVRDIDNITVIKDGSSTYGTKGANGVILITTARARELATKIDFAAYTGMNITPSRLPVLNAADYRLLLSGVLKSGGLSDADIQKYPYMNDNAGNPDYFRYHNNTDWQKSVFKNSYTQNFYLKVTGGDNIARYALSMGYMNNTGVVKNTDLTRYNMRFNGDLNLSKRLKAVTNLSFTFNEQNLVDQGTAAKTNPIYLSLTKAPFLAIKEVSGTGVESPDLADRDIFNVSNPAVIIDKYVGANKSYRFLGSIAFNYELSNSLDLISTIGITNDKVRENFFVPRKGVTSDTLNLDIAYSRLGSQVKRIYSLYNDSRLSFNKKFNQVHELSARLGMRYLQSKTERDLGLGFNSATDELISVGNGVNSLRRIGGALGESKWMNTYLNADYSLSDKYFLSFNMAMDGSSRFGKEITGNVLTISGNKYALLPSVAGGWLLSSENFMQSRFIDLLKLRASFGLSGNDDIGNYTARQYYVSQNLLGMQGLVRGDFGNSHLQWEAMQKINVGLDVALFNERINISLDAYRNKVDKMIIYEPSPTASGLSFAVTNTGGMKTKGLEASVNARIINKTSVKWDIGFNVSHYQSEISKLPVDKILTDFAGASLITKVGSDPNLFYGYKTNGVYSTDAIALQEGLSVRKADGTLASLTGGDVRFLDMNGDKIIDQNDRQVIGNPNPGVIGSIINKVEYKRLSLEALFTFSKGNDIYNYTRNQLESLSGAANQTEAVINRWRTNGDVTDVPKATWGDPMGNSRFSDRWIEDGSYLRFRTATLSYNVPVKPGFLKYAVVYLTGNNIFTLTKYKGYDPEFSATESIFGQGVDVTLEPQFRSVQFGARIGL
jgi:TonB-linked SusC/RagA family outer membrane protein